MFKTIIKILQGLEDKIDPPKSKTIRTTDEAWKAWNSAPSTIEPALQPYVPGQIISCGSSLPYNMIASDSLESFRWSVKLHREKDETYS